MKSKLKLQITKFFIWKAISIPKISIPTACIDCKYNYKKSNKWNPIGNYKLLRSFLFGKQLVFKKYLSWRNVLIATDAIRFKFVQTSWSLPRKLASENWLYPFFWSMFYLHLYQHHKQHNSCILCQNENQSV